MCIDLWKVFKHNLKLSFYLKRCYSRNIYIIILYLIKNKHFLPYPSTSSFTYVAILIMWLRYLDLWCRCIEFLLQHFGLFVIIVLWRVSQLNTLWSIMTIYFLMILFIDPNIIISKHKTQDKVKCHFTGAAEEAITFLD